MQPKDLQGSLAEWSDVIANCMEIQEEHSTEIEQCRNSNSDYSHERPALGSDDTCHSGATVCTLDPPVINRYLLYYDPRFHVHL